MGGDDSDQPQERLLNVTVSGRTKTFNMFGNNCPDGTPLYIVLKEIPEGDKHITYNLNLNAMTKTVTRSNGQKSWRYEPYANADEPYPSGDGIKKVYYIGRVSRNSKMKSVTEGGVQSSRMSVQKMVTLPMLEMFVDYGFTL